MSLQTNQTPPPQQTPPSSSFQQSKYIMSAKLTSAKSMSSMLSTLLIAKKTRAKFVMTAEGIKVYVLNDAKSLQCVALLKRQMFQSYIFTTDVNVAEFGLSNLSDLIDCLNIYGAAAKGTSVVINFPGPERCLSVLLTENGRVTDCGLRTIESFDHLSYKLVDKVAVIKVDSSTLRDAINEVDYLESNINLAVTAGDHEVQQEIPPSDQTDYTSPGLRLSAKGSAGIFDVFIPAHNCEAMKDFKCSRNFSEYYFLDHFKYLAKSLHLSETAVIAIDEKGFLAIQHHVKIAADGGVQIVEYMMSPEEGRFEGDEMTDEPDFVPSLADII